MKKALAALAIISMLALTGCNTPPDSGDNNGNWYITTLNDPATGTKVRCAINGFTSESGITCDWAGAK